MRGFGIIPTGDFLAAAKVGGEQAMAAVKATAEGIYASEWRPSISPGCFLMLVAACVFHNATAIMAKENDRDPDINAMMLGVKAYGMTFDYIIQMESDDIQIVAGMRDDAGGETRH
jgi:hypothetical protein